jgi:polar amino acid transport system substrate-binding protein
MKICAVLLLVLCPWLAQARMLLSICYETADLAPFISAGSNDSEPVGILVDMLYAAASTLDIELQFHRAPWLRCQKMVQQNQLNATLAMIWSAQRAQHFRFPDQETGTPDSGRYLWQAQYPVFTKAAKPFLLSQYQPQFGIGAPLGYIVEAWLQRKGWLSPYKLSPESGLQLVVDGKLDGYSVERVVGLHHLQRLQLKGKVVASEDNLVAEKWFLVTNPDFYRQNQKLVEQLWFNLADARQAQEAHYQPIATTEWP